MFTRKFLLFLPWYHRPRTRFKWNLLGSSGEEKNTSFPGGVFPHPSEKHAVQNWESFPQSNFRGENSFFLIEKPPPSFMGILDIFGMDDFHTIFTWWFRSKRSLVSMDESGLGFFMVPGNRLEIVESLRTPRTSRKFEVKAAKLMLLRGSLTVRRWKQAIPTGK